MKPLSTAELKKLRDYLETGDPIKDLWDESELIRRLVARIDMLEKANRALEAELSEFRR